MANPGLFFVYFCSFKQQFYRKIVNFSGIRTLIVRAEGEHADHLTTTTAQMQTFCIFYETGNLTSYFTCCGLTSN